MTRDPNEVLAEAISLDGADVLDVGCGAGELVRWMRSQGARATGVECGAEMRARALAADPGHAASYVDGVGQDLPFDDASFDAVVFSASLHHVPVDDIPAALREARRVVRRGGVVYISEPAVETPEDDVLSPLIDETAERTAAQEAIDAAAAGDGFELAARFEFEKAIVVPDFDEWMAVIVDIETDRADALEANRDEIRAEFERIGERVDGGWRFTRRSLVAVLIAS